MTPLLSKCCYLLFVTLFFVELHYDQVSCGRRRMSKSSQTSVSPRIVRTPKRRPSKPRTTSALAVLDDFSNNLCTSSSLPKIENGFYLQTAGDSTVGASRRVRCNDGYNLVGAYIAICQPNGVWTTPGYCVSTQRTTRCSKLPEIENGVVSDGLSSVGAVRNVTCDDGFVTSTPTITCQSDGAWTEPAVCTEMQSCPDVPTISNGYFVPTKQSLSLPTLKSFGSILELRCNECYEKTDPLSPALISCSGGRRLWTRTRNSCVKIECPTVNLPTVANGRVEDGDSTCNASRAITCNPGYVRLFADSITCQPDGQWSKLVTVCAPIGPPTTRPATTLAAKVYCSSLAYPKIENGYVDESGTWSMDGTVGSIRRIVCNTGHRLANGLLITMCLPDGSWSNPLAICTPIATTPPKNCPLLFLPTLANGYYLGLKENSTMGAVVKVICYRGYTLYGPANVSCLSDGSWTLPGVCVADGSSQVTDVVNVITTTRIAITTTTTKEITCSPDSYPKIPNGRVDDNPLLPNNVGAMRGIVCNNGFSLKSGISVTACQQDGTWSQPGTVCSRTEPPVSLTCMTYNMPVIMNGYYVGLTEATAVGIKVKVTCYEGYTLTGPSEVICDSKGKWSEPGTCSPNMASPTLPPIVTKSIYCIAFNLPFLTNGYYSGLRDASSPGMVINIKCYDGYVLVGAGNVTCLPTSNWTAPGACRPAIPPSTTMVPLSASSTQSSTLTQQTSCLATNAPFVANGFFVGLKAYAPIGSTATIVCYTGFIVSGPSNITCLLSGDWSTPGRCVLSPTEPLRTTFISTTESIKPCLFGGLPLIMNGFFMGMMALSRPGDVAKISCYDGYIVAGAPNVTCLPSGDWTQAGTCIPVPTTTTLTTTLSTTICPSSKLPFLANGYFVGLVAISPSGSTAKVVCYEGYKVIGPANVTCLSTGEWSEPGNCTLSTNYFPSPTTEKATTSSRTCVSAYPPLLLNGYFIGFKTIAPVGTVVKIKCYEGFSNYGPNTITCLPDGEWSQAGTCANLTVTVEKPCFAVNSPFVQNGYLEGLSGMVPPGGKAFVKCYPGYRPIGPTNITCLLTGQWTMPGSCEFVQPGTASETTTMARSIIPVINGCTNETLPLIENGHIQPDEVASRNFYPIGTFRLIACNQGYEFESGSDVTACMGFNIWSNPYARCILTVTTPPPFSCTSRNYPKIPNGIVVDNAQESVYFSTGSARRVICNDGYRFSSGLKESIFCKSDGNWTLPTGNCTQIPGCPISNLPIVSNGYLAFSAQGNAIVGALVTIKCYQDYVITGPADVTCLESGNWSSPGRCVPASVTEKPTEPTSTTSSTTTVMTTTTPISCSNNTFPNITNGHVDPGTWGWKLIYPINAFRPVVCNPGYEFTSGYDVTTCLGMDEWSNPFVVCTRITTTSTTTTTTTTTPTPACTKVGYPKLANAVILEERNASFNVGATRRVVCNDGFELTSGFDTIFCKNDLTWSQPFTICTPIGCSVNVLPKVEDGYIDKASFVRAVSFGSLMNVKCNDGYIISGASAVVCQATGSWSQPGQCVLEKMATGCSKLPTVKNGVIQDGFSSVGAIRIVECQPGFTALVRQISCQANGKWTDPEDCSKIAEDESCPEPPPVMNGFWSVSKVEGNGTFRSLGTVMEMQCSENCYTRSGPTTPFIRCGRNRQWTQIQLFCKRVECSSDNVPDVENGRIEDGYSTCGSTREIICNPGYVLTGLVNTIVCQNDSYWSSPSSRCVSRKGKGPESCGEVPEIAHGRVEEGGYFVGARRKVFCDTGYRIDTLPYFVMCRPDGAWSKPPQCTQAGCYAAPPPNIGVEYSINENMTNAGLYRVGALATVNCMHGYRLIISGTLACTEDGLWAGTPGQCQRVRCFSLPQVLRGYYRPNDMEPYYVGSTATLLCSAGYKPNNSTTITCGLDGNWQDAGTCVPKQCGNVPMIDRGVITVGSFEIGSKRDIICNYGSAPNGATSIVCKEDGTWSSPGNCAEMK